jgi:DNA-binding NtrC family response regulator
MIGSWVRSTGIKDVIRKLALSDCSVLFTGETGVGKGALARLIASNSSRKEKAFIELNCASIPDTLIESILFGHVKGSFTSADKDHVGYFEEANYGTIFLDEIAETTPFFQAKLLKVLDDKVIRRIGGKKDIHIDVRVMAATNKDLLSEVRKGNFREDLYYRIKVYEMQIPPLHQRLDDIPLLVKHFIEKISLLYDKTVSDVAPETMQILLKHRWSGNVRELKSAIESAIVMSSTNILTPNNLPNDIIYQGPHHIGVSKHSQCFDMDLRENEEGLKTEEIAKIQHNQIDWLFEQPYSQVCNYIYMKYLIHLLSVTKGNIKLVAKKSKLDRKTIYKKIKEFGLDINDFRKLNLH